MAAAYDCVAVAGTFDRLHAGHRVMLGAAATSSKRKVLLAVATPALHGKKKYAELIQPLGERMAAAKTALAELNPGLEVEVVPLSDPMGPAATSAEMDAIVLSTTSELSG